jgi:Tol biopolymer transport system component
VRQGHGSDFHPGSLNGGNRKKITQRPAFEWASAPDWNQDGNQIAFTITLTQDSERWSSNIFQVDEDGSNVHQITFSPSPIRTGRPRWSPDGKSIVFASTRDYLNELESDIYLIVPATQKTIRLTTSGFNGCPVWIPSTTAALESIPTVVIPESVTLADMMAKHGKSVLR